MVQNNQNRRFAFIWPSWNLRKFFIDLGVFSISLPFLWRTYRTFLILATQWYLKKNRDKSWNFVCSKLALACYAYTSHVQSVMNRAHKYYPGSLSDSQRYRAEAESSGTFDLAVLYFVWELTVVDFDYIRIVKSPVQSGDVVLCGFPPPKKSEYTKKKYDLGA